MANKFPGIKAYNGAGEPTDVTNLREVWFLDYTNATHYTIDRYVIFALEQGYGVPDHGELWELVEDDETFAQHWMPHTPKNFDEALKDAQYTIDPFDYD